MSDQILIRRRIEDVRQDLHVAADRRCDDGPRSMVVKTAVLSVYPTSINAYFYVQAIKFGGAQTEGTTPTQQAGGYFFAANVGSHLPPLGTMLIATETAGRWTVAYNG